MSIRRSQRRRAAGAERCAALALALAALVLGSCATEREASIDDLVVTGSRAPAAAGTPGEEEDGDFLAGAAVGAIAGGLLGAVRPPADRDTIARVGSRAPAGTAAAAGRVSGAAAVDGTRGPSPPPIALPPPVAPRPSMPAIGGLAAAGRGNVDRDRGRPLRASAPAGPMPAAPAPAAAAPTDMVRCARVEEMMPRAECERLMNLDEAMTRGVGSFAPPRSMYRGETRTVRLALVEGSEQGAADAMVAAGGDPIVRIADVTFGRFMEARLSGEGFDITPTGRIRQDVYINPRAVWEWQVTAKRSPRHMLRVEAWVLTRTADGSLGEARYAFHPPIEVDVPVRFYPDRVDDFFADSGAWISKGTNWLKLLAGLLAAAGGVWAAARGFGKKRPKKRAPAPADRQPPVPAG